uniref:NADH-ubiquinone oxidoreductase chain 3 n=1 Tax=Neilupotamon xinganense TaxID=2739372 RepID=A0A7D3Q5A0_9EUCA|nr:NADH dehydrogenase subunit 3 [Neilupotamon xinganense]QKE31062.1 NADH dehydrogenase subunit 3 [Neilupotamon xinganense]
MLLISTFTLLISSIIMILTSTLAKKTISDREKNSPYECGFDPSSSSRLPFSLRFFLIAVIFLIFDVEITLLLPITSTINLSNVYSWLSVTVFFLLGLLLGLYYEWYQGALEWSK